MFEHDYTLNGKHATMLKFIANSKAQEKDNVGCAAIFNKYITVYLNAAIWGLLYNRTALRDNESEDRARIYADAFNTERETCVFIYRLVMLLDPATKLSNNERIDRAFRDDAKPDNDAKMIKNLDAFNAYVRGGIEQMYETFIEGCTTKDDYFERIIEVMARFSDEVSGISFEDRVLNLLKSE